MDSGNSGSLQSSSGEDEFDSRADAISAATAAVAAAMMNNNPRGGGPSPSPPPPPPPPLSSGMFDLLSSSSFFDSIPRPPPQQLPFHQHHNNNNSNPVLNLDMSAWSKTLRSDPNCTEIINNNSLSFQSLFTHQNHDLQNPLPPPSTTTLPAAVVPPENSTTTNTTARPDHQPQPHGQRNPKKRSRASRRAPTTVLTTDTTNFRAMVQEFTGIPAPPFTASSSPFPRARGLLDLYGTPSTIRSSNHHYSLDNSSISTTNTNTVSTPSYLRRPFPQKAQLPPPPFLSSAAAAASSSSSSAASHLINYQLSSSPPQSSSLFNVPNQILTSLLQSNNNPSKSSLPFLDDFGLGHGGGGGSVNPNPTTTTTTTTNTLSGLPGLISSDQTVPRTNSINDNVPPPPPIINWGNGIGSSIHDENDHHECHHQVVRGNNASSDNAATGAGGGGGGRGGGGRGEGMMESWICSSD